jgi:predicted RNA-binding protein Jag
MTERIVIEADNLGAALNEAIASLGADSIAEISYKLDKDHFRQGAFTVKLAAWIRSEEEIAELRSAQLLANEAKKWAAEALAAFGTECAVSARRDGNQVHVQVMADSDASLLIGREGKNIRAFQLLLTEALKRVDPDVVVKLDVESTARRDDDRGRGRDRDDRGRGRGRDRDDRGGRGRGGDRDRGRGGDRPRGGDRARGGDRDRGGDRPRGGDREGGEREPREERRRDEDIAAEARKAADQVIAGDEESIRLGRMNSYERHVAHSTIKEIDGVDSRSVGRGSRKRVEVFAPE